MDPNIQAGVVLLVVILIVWAVIKAPSWFARRPAATTVPAPATTPAPKKLEEMSAAELREIAARYRLKITGKAGNTANRIAIYILSMVLLLTVLVWCAALLPAPIWVRLFMLLGLTLVVLPATTWGIFLVSVPQLAAAKAKNRFGGRVHTFTTGWNIKFPWERVGLEDFLTLRSDIVTGKISTPTKDRLIATFEEPMLRWRVFPELLLVNASHSEDAIKRAAKEIFESVVSEEVAKVEMENLPTILPDIQEKLEQALYNPNPLDRDIHGSTFQEQYGVVAEVVALGAPSLPQDYREAKEGVATMRIYDETVRNMVEASRPSPDAAPTITYAQALDSVMINAKENVSKEIKVISFEADDNFRNAAGDFGTAIGPALAGFAAALGSSKGSRKK